MWSIVVSSASWAHPWPSSSTSHPLVDEIPAPPGFLRSKLEPTSFGAWLRTLPIKPGRPAVALYNGRPKRNQEAHFKVLDIDVGRRDLQQCADAVMRLFAEYQWATGSRDRICFRFTSGARAEWPRWRAGERPAIRGRRVVWAKTATSSGGYATFRAYLDTVFTYAGTRSLALDLGPVADPAAVQAGDVFIKGGSPGHAVLVVDTAENEAGERRFLLAQSYMPAQEIHILRHPEHPLDPWYTAHPAGALNTPEWSFVFRDLRRFSASGCR